VLSYGLRLNVALAPFLVPIVGVAAVMLFCTGHRDDAAWLGAIAALEIAGYGIAKFWISTIEQEDAREWQRLNRDGRE
jgi:hypothetical protein